MSGVLSSAVLVK